MSSLTRKRPVKKQHRYVKISGPYISGPYTDVRRGSIGMGETAGLIGGYIALSSFDKGYVITLIYGMTLLHN